MKKKRKRKRKSHLLHTIEQEKVIESEDKGSKTYPKPKPYRRCLYSRRRHHPLHHHRLQRRSIGEKPSLLCRDPNHRWPPSLASPPRTTAAAEDHRSRRRRDRLPLRRRHSRNPCSAIHVPCPCRRSGIRRKAYLPSYPFR